VAHRSSDDGGNARWPRDSCPSVCIGRNEGGLQHFHRWVDRILDTPDNALNELSKSIVATACPKEFFSESATDHSTTRR
jgi:hypothetical protein